MASGFMVRPRYGLTTGLAILLVPFTIAACATPQQLASAERGATLASLDQTAKPPTPHKSTKPDRFRRPYRVLRKLYCAVTGACDKERCIASVPTSRLPEIRRRYHQLRIVPNAAARLAAELEQQFLAFDELPAWSLDFVERRDREELATRMAINGIVLHYLDKDGAFDRTAHGVETRLNCQL